MAVNTLLLLAWLLPLGLAPLGPIRWGRWLLVIAPLAALAAWLLVPVGSQIVFDWVLLGMHLGLDPAGHLFLLFSAMLWLFAGLYEALSLAHDERAGRFRVFFLLTMAGNLLLVLAADMVTFYVGFALMGVAAYGLVAHRRSQRARYAARVYLSWTVVGEVLLFSAVILLAASGDSLRFADLPGRDLPGVAVALLVLGFGVKLALPGLHFWLPLAYPAAPAVAAAVLSGPMINAGLLGWLRFLPPGAPGLAGWGELLMGVGAVGVALGILAGVVQRDPRAVLGYSSIAKMGLITAVFGVALAQPETASAIAAALVLFAMHHLLVKGALFLGVGEWERVGNRPWLLAGLSGLALALAAAPLTGGAAAKAAMSDALAGAGADLILLFAFSATGTVLLMARFLWLVGRADSRLSAGFKGTSLTWLILACLALWLPFGPAELSPSDAGLVPLAIGLAMAVLAWALTRGRSRSRRGIPPGDFLHLLTVLRRYCLLHVRRERSASPKSSPDRPPAKIRWRAPRLTTAGFLWISVFVVLLTVLLSG